MLINISEVLTEPHSDVVVDFVPEMDPFRLRGRSYRVTDITPFHLTVSWAEKGKLLITASGSLVVHIPCDRCLDDVPTVFSVSFERRVSLGGECGEEEDDSNEADYIDGYHLDAEKLLCGEMIAGWPMKVLCSEDCKGICSVCGQNLNEGTCDCEDTSPDPRMSVIRDVFKNFKEV